MSKTNLTPNPYNITLSEVAEVNWERNPNFDPNANDRSAWGLYKRISAILDEDESIPKRLNRLWALISDEPLAELAEVKDEMIIPYWYGQKPQKKSRWQRFVAWVKR